MNPNHLVFWTDSSHDDERWWCYADGTYERAPKGPDLSRQFIEAQYDLDAAGYPAWATCGRLVRAVGHSVAGQ